jgi:hypothetical protein
MVTEALRAVQQSPARPAVAPYQISSIAPHVTQAFFEIAKRKKQKANSTSGSKRQGSASTRRNLLRAK